MCVELHGGKPLTIRYRSGSTLKATRSSKVVEKEILTETESQFSLKSVC
jgi:hypothetical protein